MIKKFFNIKNILSAGFILFACACIAVCLLSNLEADYVFRVGEYSDWDVRTDLENSTVSYSARITKALEGQTVSFRSFDSFVRADIDGSEVYSYGVAYRFLKSPGTLYHMVAIPEGTAGRELSIRIAHVYPSMFTANYRFSLGNNGDIVLGLIRGELGDILANLILLTLGGLLLVLYWIEYRNKHRDESSLYLGLITVSFVVWSLGNKYICQLVFPNAILRYLVYYYTLYTLPLLIISYMKTLSDHLRTRDLFVFHGILSFVLVLLHFSGIAEMTQTVAWFCVIAGMELVVAAVRFWHSANKNKAHLLYAFLVFIGTILINGGIYLSHPAEGTQVIISKLGMCFYLLVASADITKEFVNELANLKNAELLKIQAYTDNLTKLGNRYAFDERIQQAPLEELSLVSMDINNLKQCNDTYGHVYGDQMIKAAAEILKDVYGTVYRTGGDEYIVILERATEEQLLASRRKIRERERTCFIKDMQLEIACGHASYRKTDTSYEDILRRADAEMYADKRGKRKEK